MARARPRNAFDALDCIKVAAKAVRAHLMGYELWSLSLRCMYPASLSRLLFLFTLLILLFPRSSFRPFVCSLLSRKKLVLFHHAHLPLF